jgi:two-component system, cell cycle response regulator
MDKRNIKVLLIEKDANDARLINEFLSIEPRIDFEVQWAENLLKSLEYLGAKPFDVILLDVHPQENAGLDALNRVYSMVPEIPILVMTGSNDESLGINSVQNGAQDYLVKETISRNLLVKSITYAIERNRLQNELLIMAHNDELTKLYNRRGFLALAQQQRKIACRTNRGTLLFFIDLDGMKKINDSFGHKEGDIALIETAKILKETFRESDIISRIGGDEFVILAIEINESFSEMLINRIKDKTEQFNLRSKNNFKLSLSIGVIHINPQCTSPIEELITRADESMYNQKRSKQK